MTTIQRHSSRDPKPEITRADEQDAFDKVLKKLAQSERSRNRVAFSLVQLSIADMRAIAQFYRRHV